jgi:hypothetical protein
VSSSYWRGILQEIRFRPTLVYFLSPLKSTIAGCRFFLFPPTHSPRGRTLAPAAFASPLSSPCGASLSSRSDERLRAARDARFHGPTPTRSSPLARHCRTPPRIIVTARSAAARFSSLASTLHFERTVKSLCPVGRLLGRCLKCVRRDAAKGIWSLGRPCC